MQEYRFEDLTVIEQVPDNNAPLPFTVSDAKKPLRFHKSLPAYTETPLFLLQSAADHYGVDSIFVKDESSRFGLKAFKGLGGSYCMFRILCEKLGIDADCADYSDFQKEAVREACKKFEFATATDGNHGKGVSWAAKLFGCKAHVYMPKGTVEARRRAIEEAGSAKAVITDLNYDATVQYAAALAKEKGWILIQDTSMEGYEKYPEWIIEGYLTLADEIASQMGGRVPTHIFLQAGVGSMAGGIESYFMDFCGENKPLVSIVEPLDAACVYRSAQIGDGFLHTVTGEAETIMAGLNCGTPCGVVWPILRDCSAFYFACEDSITKRGMCSYAKPFGSDPALVSGESGAVTYGLLLSALESPDLRKLLRLDEHSVILLISTEGDTDPEGYKRITQERKN